MQGVAGERKSALRHILPVHHQAPPIAFMIHPIMAHPPDVPLPPSPPITHQAAMFSALERKLDELEGRAPWPASIVPSPPWRAPPPPLQAAAFSALERKLDELEAEGRGREERWRAVMEEARGMADAQLEMSNRKW